MMTMLISLSYLAACFILGVAIYLMLRPMLFGAIYFPTTPNSVTIIRKFATLHRGDLAADLGSGDGRVLIALAKDGAEAHGYEINPLLVWNSRRAIRKAGLEGKAIVHWQSFWKADLSRYHTVVVYGFPHIMKNLGQKLQKELPPGAKVISNVFSFPNLDEVQAENRVLLYVIKRN